MLVGEGCESEGACLEGSGSFDHAFRFLLVVVVALVAVLQRTPPRITIIIAPPPSLTSPVPPPRPPYSVLIFAPLPPPPPPLPWGARVRAICMLGAGVYVHMSVPACGHTLPSPSLSLYE